MRILKEDTVAIVIDIQEKLLPHIHDNEHILDNSVILIEGLRVLDIPVLISEQYRKGLGPTVEKIQHAFPAFQPMEKMTFSCCDDQDIMSVLREQDRKNVILLGIETHVCVLQTVLDLLENGFQPIVVEDCTSSRKTIDKEIAIERMRQEGAIVSSYESILFELARISGTETFKSISRLVK